MSSERVKSISKSLNKANKKVIKAPNDNSFPLWQLNDNEEVKIRFLPDADIHNKDTFYIFNEYHNFENSDDSVLLKCNKKDCCVCKAAQKAYSAADKTSGGFLYKKSEYVTQALILQCPDRLNEPNQYIGKIKYFCFTKDNWHLIENTRQFSQLKAGNNPLTEINNFNIICNKKGSKPDFSKSGFDQSLSTIPEEFNVKNIEPRNLSELREIYNATDEQARKLYLTSKYKYYF